MLTVASELLILSLDLVKNRVGVMGPDMRKGFIGGILVGLIEKTQDNKVIKAITKMVEDWVKIKVPSALIYSMICTSEWVSTVAVHSRCVRCCQTYKLNMMKSSIFD